MSGLINFLILLGVVQGFALSLFLFFTRQKPTQGRYFLAVLMLVLVYNGLETLNWSARWFQPFFSIYTFTPIFAFGPSLYFYILSITRSQPSTWQKFLGHYSLFFIQFFLRSALLIFLLTTDNQVVALFFDQWQSLIAEPLSWIFTSVYIFWAWQAVKEFNEIKAKEKTHKPLIIKWLKTFLVFANFIVCFWAFSLIGNNFLPEIAHFSYYYPTEILLVVMMYWLGFTTYHQIYLLSYYADNEALISKNFTDSEIANYLQMLKNAMEKEQLYLDNELTVNKLANHLKINAKTVSAVLNQQLKKGFNEFVNEYRVAEVKKQLLSTDNQHLTLSGIAYEAGFNSQATFQRVFKNIVGMTPSEYLAQNQAFNKA
jgi:AraC-like DNA-binding protein